MTKRPYVKPRLKRLGLLRRLTRFTGPIFGHPNPPSFGGPILGSPPGGGPPGGFVPPPFR